jgi:hypothetical protein
MVGEGIANAKTLARYWRGMTNDNRRTVIRSTPTLPDATRLFSIIDDDH